MILGLKKFAFNVLSTNINPIECYHNFNLDENSKIFQFEEPIFLYPNQKNKINIGLIKILSENKMYSLKFKCYNLPGFKYRYKTTGTMVMYTYLNTGGIEQLIDFFPNDLKINCNEKVNQQNPRCLFDKAIPLIQNLQTDIPSFIKNKFNNAKFFSRLVLDAKNKYINILINDYIKHFREFKFKDLIEKATIILDYLAKLDCYIYSSGNSINENDTIKSKQYEQCREQKKNYTEIIINSIKPMLKCSFIIKYIIEEVVNNDLEEKFKYFLFLINEMSLNQDSYKKNLSQTLFDTSFCLQDNFDILWTKISYNLKKTKKYLDSTIKSVKKDALIIIFQTLTNFAKIIHFEEIDN